MGSWKLSHGFKVQVRLCGHGVVQLAQCHASGSLGSLWAWLSRAGPRRGGLDVLGWGTDLTSLSKRDNPFALGYSVGSPMDMGDLEA